MKCYLSPDPQTYVNAFPIKTELKKRRLFTVALYWLENRTLRSFMQTGGFETERYISWWCTVMVLVTGMVKGKTGGVETERYISWWCTVMVLVTGMVKGKTGGFETERYIS
jgi:hypothetical protein